MIKHKFFWNIFFITSIFLIDRITKLSVIHLADELGETYISLTPFLNVNLIWNEGIAFGLFSLIKKFITIF